jgi:hypothetical protein
MITHRLIPGPGNRKVGTDLSTGTESGQPDGRPLLTQQLGTFLVRDRACEDISRSKKEQ